MEDKSKNELSTDSDKSQPQQLQPKWSLVAGKYPVNNHKPANPKWLKDVFPPNTQESPAQSEDAESPVRAMVVSPVAIQKRMEFLASLDENGNLHPDLNQEGERAAKVEKLKATLEQHKQAKGNRPTRAIVEPRGSLVPFKLNTKSEDES